MGLSGKDSCGAQKAARLLLLTGVVFPRYLLAFSSTTPNLQVDNSEVGCHETAWLVVFSQQRSIQNELVLLVSCARLWFQSQFLGEVKTAQ